MPHDMKEMPVSRSPRSWLIFCLLATSTLVHGGCTSFRPPEVRIEEHALDWVEPIRISAYSAGRALERGMVSEVVEYLESLPPAQLEKPKLLEVYGQGLLAMGRAREAREVFVRAQNMASPSSERGARLAWLESQAAFQMGEPALAADPAAAAARRMKDLTVPPGWVAFLQQLKEENIQLNVIGDGQVKTRTEMGRIRVPRLAVEVNGRPLSAVIDTGASLTFVSERAAEKAGIVPFEGTDAEGSGLHGRIFPVQYGLIRKVDLGGLEVGNIAVGVVPDWVMEFETDWGRVRFDVLLGTHLWKELYLEIDYPRGEVTILPRSQAPERPPVLSRNLYLADGKTFVRGSLNGSAPFRFLLDTGSEFTLVHQAGYQRYGRHLQDRRIRPVTIHGLGQAQFHWREVPDVTIGVGDYQLRFEHLLLTDQDDVDDDGIIGTTFLQSFRVVFDFQRNELRLWHTASSSPSTEGSP